MAYALYDWPTIQGRGEFVRLALEGGRRRIPFNEQGVFRPYPELDQ